MEVVGDIAGVEGLVDTGVVGEEDIELAAGIAVVAGTAADIDLAARRYPVGLAGNTRLRRLHVEVGCMPLCTTAPIRCFVSSDLLAFVILLQLILPKGEHDRPNRRSDEKKGERKKSEVKRACSQGATKQPSVRSHLPFARRAFQMKSVNHITICTTNHATLCSSQSLAHARCKKRIKCCSSERPLVMAMHNCVWRAQESGPAMQKSK